MATKKPLCHYAGDVKELVSGDTVAKADVGLGNVDNTSDANKPVSTAQASALALKQDLSGKDASGGYAGLTLFKLNLRNAANTITSWFTTAATAARTWTMPDKDGFVPAFTGNGIVDVSASGNLLINTLSDNGGGAKLQVNGGTCLGESSPSIKIRKFSGTFPATNSLVTFATHNIPESSILGIFGITQEAGGLALPDSYENTVGHKYNLFSQNGNLNVAVVDGTNLFNRPFTATIIYEA